MRHQFLLQFGYIGTNFYGIQPQVNLPTVGESIATLVTEAAKRKPKALQFSARTDRGVHALHNFATFWFDESFDRDDFIKRIKRLSKKDIFIGDILPVKRTVHARGSSKGKWYRYVLEDNSTDKTAANLFAWQIAPTLSQTEMQKAASFLEGSHDFSSFRAGGCQAGTPVKHIEKIKITRVTKTGQIHIDIYANAFLRKMIRNLTGLLVEIGSGIRKASDAKIILGEKNRQKAGITAPPQGLMLMQVFMDEIR